MTHATTTLTIATTWSSGENEMGDRRPANILERPHTQVAGKCSHAGDGTTAHQVLHELHIKAAGQEGGERHAAPHRRRRSERLWLSPMMFDVLDDARKHLRRAIKIQVPLVRVGGQCSGHPPRSLARVLTIHRHLNACTTCSQKKEPVRSTCSC
jgi:hypothetical protein